MKQITDYSGARRCGAVFEELVGLIHRIKDDSIGEWIVDKENDGTPEHPIQMPFIVYSRVVRQFERVYWLLHRNS